MQKIVIFTDGGARGNPGPAACGVYMDNGKKFARYLGVTTNNQAEYQGVILALEKAQELKAEELVFYLDSLLVVSQLNGKFKVKDQGLASLFVKIWNLKANFKKVSFYHVPREKNKEADALVNECLDKYQK